MTLKTRFYGIAAVLVASFLALLLMQRELINEQELSWQDLRDEALAREEALLLIRANAGYGAMIHNFKNYVLRGQEKYYGRIVDNHQGIQKAINQYRAISSVTAEEKQALLDIEAVYQRYRDETDRVAGFVKQGHTAEQLDQQVKISDGPAVKGLQVLEKNYRRLIEEYTSEFEQISRSGANASLLGMTIALVVLLVGLLYLSRYIIYRMRKFDEAVLNLTQGEVDLSRRLPEEGGDEFEAMARHMNRFMGKLAELIGSVKDQSLAIQAGLSQIESNENGNTDRFSRQQGETVQLATAVEELAATAHSVADSTGNAVQAVDDARHHFDNGVQALEDAVKRMETLSEGVHGAAGVINSLKEKTDEIGNIVDVIGGVAEQTNLLALNAAIEAARAGEQGRGFAVVADEVRTLASRTQESTEEIRRMIEELQKGSEQAVDVMSKSATDSNESVEMVKLAEDAMQQIAQEIHRISDLNLQIAGAAEQQSEVTDTINQNIHRITKLSEENAGAMEENHQAVTDMNNRTLDLANMVQRFKF